MLHYETVSPTLLKIIKAVCSVPFFENFRLVGGTALSLYLGHRKSVDADFFSNMAFDQPTSIAILSESLPGFMVTKRSVHGYAAVYEQVKLDLYTWSVDFRLPAVEADDIRLAALPDIAALKMEAIINRKEEKDFRDLHALLQRFSLADLLQFFSERYPHFSARLVTDHLLAAPFIERDQSIELLNDASWESIGSDITQAVQHYYEEGTKLREQQAEERIRQRIESLKQQNDTPET
jgi:Nucleotidyl transferase AbiEii toxin, Type IV TA system